MTVYCTTFNPKNHEFELTCRGYGISESLKESIYSELRDIENKSKMPFLFQIEIEGNNNTITQKYEIQLSPEMHIKFLSKLLDNKAITEDEFVLKLSIEALRASFQTRVKNPFGNYIVFSESLTGARTGVLATTLAEAQKHIINNVPFIFAVSVITPEILKTIEKAAGFITTHVGLTSHASVIARGVGIPALFVNKDVIVATTCLRYNGMKIQAGTYVTLDGNAKKLYFSKQDIDESKSNIPENIEAVFSKCTSLLLNTEKVEDIERGRKQNVMSIGLLRLEHLVLQTKILHTFRKFILQRYFSEKKDLSKQLSSELVQELGKIFTEVRNNEITVRLLDPPLHEFFEITKSEVILYAKKLRIHPKKIVGVLENLREHNPMMGLRGARLMLAFHDLLDIQIEVLKTLNQNFPNIKLRIEVPFIMNATEGIVLLNKIKEKLGGANIELGIMFEIPSLLYSIEELAKHVDFISFGTNDLTQFTLGLSRDDNTTIIHQFIDHKIFKSSPFEIIEANTVGELLKEAVSRITRVAPLVDLLVCGEHAGNYESIQYFKSIGLNKFSCSVGRITEAQFAVLKQ